MEGTRGAHSPLREPTECGACRHTGLGSGWPVFVRRILSYSARMVYRSGAVGCIRDVTLPIIWVSDLLSQLDFDTILFC